MRKAYSYIRFSSKKQAGGDSLRRQKDIAAAYALTHNLDLDLSLNFTDLGVSGFTGDNAKSGALSVFIKAVESGLVPQGSVLLIENFDRLSRQPIGESLPIFQNLVKSGIDIVTLTDGKVWTKESIDNVYDLIGSLISMSRAHEESQRKGYLVKAALDRKREAKVPVAFGNGPIWLTPKNDKTGWDINEPLAESVRWAFNLYASGVGVKNIAKQGNLEGRRFGKTDRWASAQVWRFLRNPSVIGTWELGEYRNGVCAKTGETRVGYYPPIVSEDLFYSVQALLNKKSWVPGRKDPTYRNILQGIIRCGHCGTVMSRKRSTPAGAAEVATYSCGSREHALARCPTVAAHRLEPVLIPLIYSLAPTELQASERLALLSADISKLGAEETAINVKLNKISASFLEWLDLDEQMPKTMVSAMTALESKLTTVKVERDKLTDELMELGLDHANANFSADTILSLIADDSPESVALRLAEHLKIKAQFEHVFVWAEDVAAVRLKSGHTAWLPLSKRHMEPVFKLGSDRDVTVPNKQLPADWGVRNQYHVDPSWFKNRPALPEGFEIDGPSIAVKPVDISKYPEPKIVRNVSLIRPGVPVRKKPVKAKGPV